MEDIQRAITAGHAQSMAAFRHGDAAAVAACYTPEAKRVPPALSTCLPSYPTFDQYGIIIPLMQAR